MLLFVLQKENLQPGIVRSSIPDDTDGQNCDGSIAPNAVAANARTITSDACTRPVDTVVFELTQFGVL